MKTLAGPAMSAEREPQAEPQILEAESLEAEEPPQQAVTPEERAAAEASGEAGGSQRPEMPERNLREAVVQNWAPLAMLFAFFIIAQLVGMGAATQFDAAGVRAIEEQNQDKASYSLLYFGFILAFTGLVLFIARKGLDKLIKYIFLGAVGMTLIYVFYPFFWWASGSPGASFWWALAMALGLTYALVRYPEWYVVDTTGVAMAGGVAAIFGISFGLAPALILMVAMAIYDAWAVYRTKHMVALADSVMGQRIPILLVAPKKWGYSFMAQASLKEQLEEGEEREAMFMGLGDLVIPGMLIVGARVHLGWGVGFFALAGALVGFGVLMTYVLKGKPQAGLPLLNGGTIAGYALGVLAFGTEWGLNLRF